MPGSVTVLHSECRAAMRSMPESSVDAVVTDPPYGLSFMGKEWDHGVPGVEFWAEALRVAKPGAHLLAFGGTRTFHRLTCAIEDAGWEIRDCVMWIYGSGFPKSLDVSKAIDKAAGAEREVVGYGQWANRANTNAGRAMNPCGSATRTVADTRQETAPATDAARQWSGWGTALKPAWEPIIVARKPLVSACANVLALVESQLRERGVMGEIQWKPESARDVTNTSPTTASGSTGLLEQSGTSAKNADEREMQSGGPLTRRSSETHGTGGARTTQADSGNLTEKATSGFGKQSLQPMADNANAAAKPSSTSSPLTTSTAAAQSTENQYTAKSILNCADKGSHPDTGCFAGIATGLVGSMATVHIIRDSDGAFLWPRGLAKFVPGKPLTVAANVQEFGTGAINVDGCRVDGVKGIPASARKNAKGGDAGGVYGKYKSHPTDTPGWDQNAGRWPANLIHDGSDEVVGLFPNDGDKSAARFFYCAKASKRDRELGLSDDAPLIAAAEMVDRTAGTDGMNSPRAGAGRTTGSKNGHPTVKPTALMRYLCKLVTPPGGTVLDPFCGSGSTGVAAVLEGFSFVGIDSDPQWAEIARKRCTGVQA